MRITRLPGRWSPEESNLRSPYSPSRQRCGFLCVDQLPIKKIGIMTALRARFREKRAVWRAETNFALIYDSYAQRATMASTDMLKDCVYFTFSTSPVVLC